MVSITLCGAGPSARTPADTNGDRKSIVNDTVETPKWAVNACSQLQQVKVV